MISSTTKYGIPLIINGMQIGQISGDLGYPLEICPGGDLQIALNDELYESHSELEWAQAYNAYKIGRTVLSIQSALTGRSPTRIANILPLGVQILKEAIPTLAIASSALIEFQNNVYKTCQTALEQNGLPPLHNYKVKPFFDSLSLLQTIESDVVDDIEEEIQAGNWIPNPSDPRVGDWADESTNKNK